jgi:hypothetical protein
VQSPIEHMNVSLASIDRYSPSPTGLTCTVGLGLLRLW